MNRFEDGVLEMKEAMDELLNVIVYEAARNMKNVTGNEMDTVEVKLTVPKYLTEAVDKIIKKFGPKLADRGLSRQVILELLFGRLSASGFRYELDLAARDTIKESFKQLLENCSTDIAN